MQAGGFHKGGGPVFEALGRKGEAVISICHMPGLCGTQAIVIVGRSVMRIDGKCLATEHKCRFRISVPEL